MKKTNASPSKGLTVTFYGAAQSVSGSMHLLEAAGRRVLLDCGLVRGRRDEARKANRNFPFDPTSIDAVVLSHAHVDHCGNLPNLVRQGFDGPILCTQATRDLVGIMLADSARIQEDEMGVAGVLHEDIPDDDLPLYTRVDVQRTAQQFVPVAYKQPMPVVPGIELRFVDAGHLLGSAMGHLTIHQAGRDHRITFTGDLGRRGLPFLFEPGLVPPADLIISESTYGGQTHDTVEGMAEKMSGIVHRTVERGGKVLIPAFSLGRTQVVVHYLSQWMQQGHLPSLPIYIDSPLASEIAKVYERYADTLLLSQNESGDSSVSVEYFETVREARQRTAEPDPCIIVASGGMCEGGRIMEHLRQHIDDPRSSIVLVSFQAPGTVGAQLLERKPTVRFHGRTWRKWIEVAELNGFSGHADHNDFLALLGPAVESTRQIRLVHGEVARADLLAKALRQKGFPDVVVPHREETVHVA